MAELPGIKVNSSLSELFSTQEERDNARLERVVPLKLGEITAFQNHPFKVRDDEEMQRLVESVQNNGVLMPALVRPKRQGGYEMVSGHRRMRACEFLKMETMPCIVRNLTDDEATILMVDSNLQRETLLPSERAFAYKLKLDAMKRQGQRTDLTSVPLAQKSTKKTSRELLGEQVGESQDQIRRYIRLTHLVPDLLEMVDNSVLKDKEKPQIALRPAVELSYLSTAEQEALLETIDSESCTPSHAQAIKMREFSNKGSLNDAVILSIMQEQKPNQKEQFHISYDKLNRYFPANTSEREITQTIIKALDMYRSREKGIGVDTI